MGRDHPFSLDAEKVLSSLIREPVPILVVIPLTISELNKEAKTT
jgi:hypothetical protein